MDFDIFYRLSPTELIKRIVTVKKASEELKISQNTLRKWLREKKVDGMKLNGRWLLDKESLKNHLEGRK